MGYECRKCGYEPSVVQLNNGTCPNCFIDRLETKIKALKVEAESLPIIGARERRSEIKAEISKQETLLNLAIDRLYA